MIIFLHSLPRKRKVYPNIVTNGDQLRQTDLISTTKGEGLMKTTNAATRRVFTTGPLAILVLSLCTLNLWANEQRPHDVEPQEIQVLEKGASQGVDLQPSTTEESCDLQGLETQVNDLNGPDLIATPGSKVFLGAPPIGGCCLNEWQGGVCAPGQRLFSASCDPSCNNCSNFQCVPEETSCFH